MSDREKLQQLIQDWRFHAQQVKDAHAANVLDEVSHMSTATAFLICAQMLEELLAKQTDRVSMSERLAADIAAGRAIAK